MTNQAKTKPEIGTRYLDAMTGRVLVVHSVGGGKVVLQTSTKSDFDAEPISHVMSTGDFEQLIDDGLFVREGK